MQPLNIQIDRNETTRRYSRRVVWHMAAICGSIALGIMLALACIHHDWTGRESLSGAQHATYIEKSVHNLDLVSHAYRQPLLIGSPYSLSDGLSWSRYGLTRHIQDGKTIAITIDRAIPANISDIFIENGFIVLETGGETIISTIEVDLEKRKKRSLSLNILNNGRLFDFNENTSARMRLTTDFLQIRGLPRANSVKSPFGEQDYLSAWEFESLPETFRPFAAIPASSFELVSYQDEQGIGFRMKFHNSDLSVDALAQIGKEYMLQSNLSTTAWTISDGTRFSEIRNNEELTSDIQYLDGIAQILVTMNDNTLRMTQAGNLLIISNRIISLTTEENSIASNCLPRAKQILNPTQTLSIATYSAGYTAPFTVLITPSQYHQLARRGSLLRLCLE